MQLKNALKWHMNPNEGEEEDGRIPDDNFVF